MKSILCMLALACLPIAAAADTAALQRCRQIIDPAARLACYDAVVLPPTDGSAAPRSDAASTTSRPSPAVASPAAAFGLESRPTPTQSIEALESSIPGRFDGWLARGRLSLSNGQVWEISDGTNAVYDLRDPKVKITRGMVGTFFMQIEGVSQTPRVRRVQ